MLTILSVARGLGAAAGGSDGGGGGGGGGGQGKPGHTYVIHSHDYAREGCRYYEGRTDRFQHLLLHAFVSISC